jgi:AcrR family transcriptional regulator
MPRTKVLTDIELLRIAIAIATERGSENVTFSALSKRAHLAPSTLVQRFGTKQALLSSAAALCFADMSTILTAARQNHTPLTAIEDGIVAMAGSIESVHSYANGLGLFGISLSEPKAYLGLKSSAQRLHNELSTMVKEAIEARELQPVDADQLAYGLHAMYEGAIITWTMHQDGTATDWMRDRFRQFIKPYITEK